jgi:hypothetical protein
VESAPCQGSGDSVYYIQRLSGDLLNGSLAPLRSIALKGLDGLAWATSKDGMYFDCNRNNRTFTSKSALRVPMSLAITKIAER